MPVCGWAPWAPGKVAPGGIARPPQIQDRVSPTPGARTRHFAGRFELNVAPPDQSWVPDLH
jgi:hypothetical protein